MEEIDAKTEPVEERQWVISFAKMLAGFVNELGKGQTPGLIEFDYEKWFEKMVKFIEEQNKEVIKDFVEAIFPEGDYTSQHIDLGGNIITLEEFVKHALRRRGVE